MASTKANNTWQICWSSAVGSQLWRVREEQHHLPGLVQNTWHCPAQHSYLQPGETWICGMYQSSLSWGQSGEAESPPLTCCPQNYFGAEQDIISGLWADIVGSCPAPCTSTPKSFLARLLSVHSLPSLCLCSGLPWPRCLTITWPCWTSWGSCGFTGYILGSCLQCHVGRELFGWVFCRSQWVYIDAFVYLVGMKLTNQKNGGFSYVTECMMSLKTLECVWKQKGETITHCNTGLLAPPLSLALRCDVFLLRLSFSFFLLITLHAKFSILSRCLRYSNIVHYFKQKWRGSFFLLGEVLLSFYFIIRWLPIIKTLNWREQRPELRIFFISPVEYCVYHPTESCYDVLQLWLSFRHYHLNFLFVSSLVPAI